MKSARQRDTGPELAIRSQLHKQGLRYRLHRRILPDVRRQADIVFGPAKVAVFVDGCFWHSCPIHATRPKANAEWWREKLATNQRRDADTNERLSKAWWAVIRVWEHEDPGLAARKIARVVRRRSVRRPRTRIR